MSSLRRLASFVMIPLTISAACDRGSGDQRVSVEIIDGIERVTTFGAGLWDPEEVWRIGELTLRIGQLEGDGPDVFGSITGLAINEEGHVHVADGQAREIRVFSPEGDLLFQFGRTGEGPGEFTAIDAVAILPDGRIVVRDPRLSRISIFSREGEFRSTFRLERPFMQFAADTGLWTTHDGLILDRMTLIELTGERSSFIAVVVYSPEGRVIDTLRVIEVPSVGSVQITSGGVPMAAVSIPFQVQPIVTAVPDGTIAAGSGAEYGFNTIALNGTPQRSILRGDRTPDIVTDRDREEGRSVLSTRVQEIVPGGDIGSFEFPSRKPAYTHLFGDLKGNWWAGHRHAPMFGEEPSEYDVYDPAGRFLGSIPVPALSILQIGGSYIAGVSRDELGIESVVVYSLLKPNTPGQ